MKELRFERARQIVISLALCLTATPALAGIADSPLPATLAGYQQVYSVPGVISHSFSSPNLATFFSCTSTDTVPMQLAVEPFDKNGISMWSVCADTSFVPFTVNPGATVVVATRPAVGIPVDLNLGTCGTAPNGQGSARILATSKKLACTAFVADWTNAPPTTSWQLTIIKKAKQKGD